MERMFLGQVPQYYRFYDPLDRGYIKIVYFQELHFTWLDAWN